MSHRAGEQYEVQRGDTVLRIAQAFGTLTSNVVTEDHKLPDPYKLFPGQKLLVLEREAVRLTTKWWLEKRCGLLLSSTKSPCKACRLSTLTLIL